jgi:hypothetical protein
MKFIIPPDVDLSVGTSPRSEADDEVVREFIKKQKMKSKKVLLSKKADSSQKTTRKKPLSKASKRLIKK